MIMIIFNFTVQISPKDFESINPLRKAVPPREDLVEKPLIAAIVRLQFEAQPHQGFEQAQGGLDDHHTRVEHELVVGSGGERRVDEEAVEVIEDDKVRVDEDDLVVFGELEDSELAVVPLVVGSLGGEGAADAVDGEHIPAGGAEGEEGGQGEGGGVGEEDEVFGGVGAANALRQDDGAAHVGFQRVEDGGIGVPRAAVTRRGVVGLIRGVQR